MGDNYQVILQRSFNVETLSVRRLRPLSESEWFPTDPISRWDAATSRKTVGRCQREPANDQPVGRCNDQPVGRCQRELANGRWVTRPENGNGDCES